MLKTSSDTIAMFRKKAEQVSTIVVELKDINEAAEYALALCEQKAPRERLIPVDSDNLKAQQQEAKRTKVLAAPGLPEATLAYLTAAGKTKGVRVISDELRDHLEGIEVGLSVAEVGVAETATAVMPCYKENDRLAAMICETHVIVLPKAKVANTSYEIEDYLQKIMESAMYTAFVSGCSRTSDIERVLTLGVHGPLELHIALVEE